MPISDSSHQTQAALPKPPLFPTGQIVATPGALDLLRRHGLTPCPSSPAMSKATGAIWTPKTRP